MTGRQLSFDLPPNVALGAEDYFVTAANAQAHALVMGDAPWPSGKLGLVGPRQAGKSHLARLWQRRVGATAIDAARIVAGATLPSNGPVMLEDADRLAPHAEEAVFHLHNRLDAAGHALLVTAAIPPNRWGTALPDLASRMQAMTLAHIHDPDEALLRAVLAKHFADRQLSPAPQVIEWLTTRIERSFAAAAATVATLDAAALDRQAGITRAFARSVLGPDAGGAPRRPDRS